MTTEDPAVTSSIEPPDSGVEKAATEPGILEEERPLASISHALSSGKKRTALETLRADRLRELVRAFDVGVQSYRDRQALIGALADGRRIDFAEVLGRLSRDELKEMCAALGLATSGKDKGLIVERLLSCESVDPDSADPETGESPSLIASRNPSQTGLGAGKKRVALEVLRADRLRELARTFEVGVENYRDRDALIGGLADGRRLAFRTLLGELSRDELKAMCTALGLDESGKDKNSLVDRLLGENSTSDADGGQDDDDDGNGSQRQSAFASLTRLASSVLRMSPEGDGWPSIGSVAVPTGAVPVAVYVRGISRSGRNRPMERRFQNPADRSRRALRDSDNGYPLLLGVWDEQGDSRAVIVAMDAYKRMGQDTRVSLFMPLALLEEAADTGSAEHRSHSGEVIFAFRPENLPAYVERMMLEAGLRPGRKRIDSPEVGPSISIAPVPDVEADRADGGQLQIRPKVGMYAAFARLNYKPWFAISEFVDNSIQSYLSILRGESTEPLLIDIRIDEGEIVITDRAAGISKSDFPRAFSPSQPPPDPMGLSEFGLGMKAAACWFSRQWSVRTSALGEAVERTVEFDIPRITREGIESLPVAVRLAAPDDHYTVVTMSNLLVRPKGRTLGKIKDHLSSIYRVLMRKGIVRIRLSIGRTSEELQHAAPTLLVAPHFREPDGTPREWKREFNFTLEKGRRVWGWAGLLETGSVSRAGFSVFRRDRLIQGSGDETYRPSEIFRSPNSYTYQRLVGEIFVDGFDVSHTKDGIQWDGLEEVVISRLKLDLSQWDMPLLQQADGYRARRKAQDLEVGFGSLALASTGAVLEGSSIGDVLANQLQNVAPEDAPESDEIPRAPEKMLTRRTFRVNVSSGQLPWCVTIELVSDRAADWFQRGSETKIEERSIHVLVNLAHPFSEQFINDAETTLAPLLRIVCGLALAEETARESGVKHAGEIRRRLNQLLRDALGALARESDS